MTGSILVYSGALLSLAGAVNIIKPLGTFGMTRRRGAAIAVAGLALTAAGLALPVHTSRITQPRAALDRFMPEWQFREVHTLDIAAPPDRVYEAVKAVRADDIFLFRTLTWIRRGGRPLPENILNAGKSRPLLDVATSSGFVWLAQEPPRELVVGTVIISPRRQHRVATPELFQKPLAPGFAVATMNFVVTPIAGGSRVTTETRVFANSVQAQRRFATYWRVIYPGSSIIRFMWLRAVRSRAE